MGLVRTEGVILRTYPLSETSKIVHAYTLHYGPQSLMAKGARRSKSRFSGSLETFTRLELVYYKKKTRSLFTLSDCSVLESFSGLSNDLSRFYAGSVCVDMVKRFTMPEEENLALFRLLVSSLRRIGSSEPDAIESHLLSFIWQFLSIMGFRPDLRICVLCGRDMTDASVIVARDKAVGGCCRMCSDSVREQGIVDRGVGELVEEIAEGEYPGEATPSRNLLLDVWKFTVSYIRFHLHQDMEIASIGSFLEHQYQMKVSRWGGEDSPRI